jgi:hypothetical protein
MDGQLITLHDMVVADIGAGRPALPGRRVDTLRRGVNRLDASAARVIYSGVRARPRNTRCLNPKRVARWWRKAASYQPRSRPRAGEPARLGAL